MIDKINTILAEVAAEENEQRIEDEYEMLMDVLFAEHEQMMYAAYSYDNDAIYYGEH